MARSANATIGHPIRDRIRDGDLIAEATYPVTDYNTRENLSVSTTRFRVIAAQRTVVDKLINMEPVDMRILTVEGGKRVALLDAYTGGMHCCFESALVDPESSPGGTIVMYDWGNQGYSLMLSTDRSGFIFSTADDAMAYAFSSFAQSTFPIKIVAYRDEQFVDVTKEYPALIKLDAAQLWKSYLTDASSGIAPESALVAYLADEYRLGVGDSAWARVRASYGEDVNFEAKANAWLQKNGYASPSPDASSEN